MGVGMTKKEELREKIQRLKKEYTSGSTTKEEYQRRIVEIKRDLELLKRETYERLQKGFNKKLLVILLLIILILPVSYFLLKENITESKNSDIYTLKNEEESWPTFQGNPQRTGVVHGEIPDNVEVKWKFEATGSHEYGIACAYGRVYFSDDAGVFYCLDGDTGELIWKFYPEIEVDDPTLPRDNSAPTVWDKKVYFCTEKGSQRYIYSLSAIDGSKIWEYKAENTSYMGKMTAVVGGKFYTICGGISGGEVICLDASTGELLWNYKKDKWFNMYVLTVGGDKVFLNSRSSFLCLDKDTGELLWQKEFVGDTSDLIVYSDEKIYFWSGNDFADGKWYCVDANDGEILWEKDSDNTFGRNLTVFGKKIYLGYGSFKDENYSFACTDCDTGEIIWKKEEISGFLFPINNGEKIIFQSKNLICVSTKNGKKVWNHETVSLYPLGYMNKKIYLWGNDGCVYCIGER